MNQTWAEIRTHDQICHLVTPVHGDNSRRLVARNYSYGPIDGAEAPCRRSSSSLEKTTLNAQLENKDK